MAMEPSARVAHPFRTALQSPIPLWQHSPRMAARKKTPVAPTASTAADPPPVVTSPPQTSASAEKKFPWEIVNVGCAVVTVGVVLFQLFAGPVVKLQEKTDALEQKVLTLQTDVSTIKAWLRDPNKFPGAHSLDRAEGGDKPRIESAPAPSAKWANASVDGPSVPIKGMPSHIKPVAAPFCVDMKSLDPMPCEEAAQCWPPAGFAPDYLTKVAAKFDVNAVTMCTYTVQATVDGAISPRK